MELYEELEFEVIEFETNDVIITSDGDVNLPVVGG